jgi:hypothetical protein
MNTEKIERELRAANPVGKPTLSALDLAASEVALEEAILSEITVAGESNASDSGSRRRRSARLLTASGVAAAVAAALFLLLGGAGTQPTPPAYGAQLVRFAESTPLLLLEGPGWRVENVYQAGQGVYMPRSSRGTGSMEFVTGSEIPYDSVRIVAHGTVSDMPPKTVRQRKVELSWRRGKLEFPGAPLAQFPGAPAIRPVRAPVLDTTALVNTRAERIYTRSEGKTHVISLGGPGDRQMVAIWREDGLLLELRAWVSNLADFEERLGWVAKVDSSTWLDAMPPSVVKAADHDPAVREMLKGIPVPKGFRPSQIPDEGLTTNRDQVAGSVTGIVSCLWFRQWGEARRAGDRAAATEAERAMTTYKSWPILRQMAKEDGYPETILKLVASMPSGVWQYGPHRYRLLPKAEGLGCARWGIPVLPWKQRLQRHRDQRRP